MVKICDMTGVIADEIPGVELHRDEKTGRLMVRAFNEAGFNCTDVDLLSILEWASNNAHLLDGPLPRR